MGTGHQDQCRGTARWFFISCHPRQHQHVQLTVLAAAVHKDQTSVETILKVLGTQWVVMWWQRR